MKTILTSILMIFFVTELSAQATVSSPPTSQAVVDTLQNRITKLEKSIQEAQDAYEKTQSKDVTEKYQSSLLIIRIGLTNGSLIEEIVPSSIRLLAAQELMTILTDLNNPTSKVVGTSFADLAIESAQDNLLPKYPTEIQNDEGKNKFKKILNAIISNPIVQSLANSNPISGTINTVIQQAGLFQKKTSTISLTKKQLKDKKNITIPVDFTDPYGPSFDDKAIEGFYKNLEDRLKFYAAINDLNKKQGDTIQRLYVDAGVIKSALKSSKSEICKLLNIQNSDQHDQAIHDQYENLNVNQMRAKLKDSNFNRALNLSIQAQDQISEVYNFKAAVIKQVSNYIDGYIHILEVNRNNTNARFNSNDVDNLINKLKYQKTTFAKADQKI